MLSLLEERQFVPCHPWQAPRVLWVTVISAICLIPGIAYYAWNYGQATLHQTANGFTELPQPEPRQAALAVYGAAADYAPSNTRLRLHWVRALNAARSLPQTANLQAPLKAQIDQQIAAIFAWEPFFNNTHEWEVFRREYQALLHPNDQ